MTTLPETASAQPLAGARRNALVLAAASAIMGGNAAITFALGGLAGIYLLGPDKSLATLPLSAFAVGVAAGAIPAAALMRRTGRRFGFLAGALIAVASSILSGFAVIWHSFGLLVLGFALVGFAQSFTQQYRFAAADVGDPAFRARAISWVMTGGLLAAVIGPQTAILTRDALAPIPFAGAFFAMAGLGLLGFLVLLLLGGEARAKPQVARHGGRPLGVIVRQPRFIVAVLCGLGSYSVMSLVMTAAPLAMVACGLGEDNATLGIQWHVLAMFGPSFATGLLIARFGKERVIAAGLLLLAGCAAIALTGIDLLHFWAALIVLGAGWNFAFIGATAMLTETYRPEEKAKVEGLNDFLVFGSTAVASLGSGALFSAMGWEVLLLVSLPVLLACGLALVAAFVGQRPRMA